MPRNLSGVYSLPSGSLVTDGVDDILATQHNTPLEDIESDMNAARPVVAGGTGASNAADARANLGLGTMATQAASAVAVTGGSIAGITDLAVADGGTGSSTAAGARTNLGAVGLTGAETIAGVKTFSDDVQVGTFDLAFASTSGMLLDAVGTDNNGVVRVKTYATTANTAPVIVAYQGLSERFVVSANGNVTNQNNSYGAISDERLKKNVTPAGELLDAFRAVEFFNYHLNEMSDDEPAMLGVIAQKIVNQFPQLVEVGTNGFMRVNYAGLSVITSKVVQELADRIDALEARLS